MCDQQKIGFFISGLADPKSLQLTVSFFMFDQMFKSTRPKKEEWLWTYWAAIFCQVKWVSPKNIHSWQNWPSIWEIKTAVFHLQRACFRGGCHVLWGHVSNLQPTNGLPPGPGGALAVQCQKPLDEVSRVVGWRMGLPLLGFYDVSWRLGVGLGRGTCINSYKVVPP